MSDPLDTQLQRWRDAGLIDAPQSERIRGFEAQRPAVRARWPVAVALSLGGLMSSAGILLFVAANWQELSPGTRTVLLVGLVAGLHLAGAVLTERFAALATTLHAIGTVALGAAVFLAGQSYHLETDWPRGFLLWALGAWGGVLLLRSWPQYMLAGLLTPVWLVAEWAKAGTASNRGNPAVAVVGCLLLAIVYLLADGRGHRSAERTSLAVIGMIALLPLTALIILGGREFRWRWDEPSSAVLEVAAWGVALIGPLALAALLRRDLLGHALVGLAWILLGLALESNAGELGFLWAAVGAVGLMFSGAVDASRRRINVGMTGFALTVIVFYFSSVLDRLGRATSLLAGGLLFLLLGWALERVRRRLIARVNAEVAP